LLAGWLSLTTASTTKGILSFSAAVLLINLCCSQLLLLLLLMMKAHDQNFFSSFALCLLSFGCLGRSKKLSEFQTEKYTKSIRGLSINKTILPLRVQEKVSTKEDIERPKDVFIILFYSREANERND